MLIVRQVQIHQLQAACHGWLIERLGRYLEAQHPAIAYLAPPAQLRRDLEQLLPRAGAYGFVSLPDLQRYLDLCAAYGWHFEADPDHAWMNAYLRDPDVSAPDQRLALLLDECRYRDEAGASEPPRESAGTLMLRHLPERG